MPNTYLNSTIILNEALRVLHNKCNFIGNINRQYDNSFREYGSAGKPGTQLKVRLPNKYTVRTGLVANPQSTNEQTLTITVADVSGVDMEFNDVELRMNINDFSKQHIEPAMAVLASNLEAQAFTMVKDIYNAAGTPGTTPASMAAVLAVQTKLDQFLAPDEGNRTLIVNSAANASMINALSSLFHSGSELEKQYKKGSMGMALGFQWYRNQLVPVLTTGAHASITVNGASQTGTTLTLAGGTMTVGTIFTIDSVYAVHPEYKSNYDFEQQFVVTAVSGNDYTISPSIITSGAYQTVSGSPANGAAVTAAGSASTNYPMNIGFEKDAFTFVTADLELPKGLDMAGRKTYDGINMRFLRGYDIINARYISRFDVLWGKKTLRPELACRLWG